MKGFRRSAGSTPEECVGGGFAGLLAGNGFADTGDFRFEDLNAVFKLGEGEKRQVFPDRDFGLLHRADIVEVHGSTPSFARNCCFPILSLRACGSSPRMFRNPFEAERAMPNMIAVEISQPGGPEVLRPRELPIPDPLAGQVLIKVEAAGVNSPA